MNPFLTYLHVLVCVENYQRWARCTVFFFLHTLQWLRIDLLFVRKTCHIELAQTTWYTVCRRPWCFQYMAWILLSFEWVFPLVFGVQAAARLFSAQFHWYSRFVSAILLCSMTKVRFLWTRKLLAFWHFDLDLQNFLKFFQKVLWCFEH